MKRLYTIAIIFFLLAAININAVAQNLTTSGVPASLCANESFTMGFNFAGAVSGGNSYIAELSNASGTFLLPIQIGSVASTALSGTIDCTIPAGLAFGTGYKVRVRATSSIVGQIVVPSNAINISCTTRDYYWLGGAGKWSDLSKWEWTTDDVTYTPASELPTENDNVIFDDTTFPNGGRITIDVNANCNDFYWDPISAANNPDLWGRDYDLNVYGNFVLSDGVYRDARFLNFYSDKYNTYTYFGNNLINQNPNDTYWYTYVRFFGTGEFDLGNDVEFLESFQVYNGATLNTNDHDITTRDFYEDNGVINAGSSTITTGNFNTYSVFNAGSSTVRMFSDYGNETNIYGIDRTINNLIIESTICTINNSMTIANLTIQNGGGMALANGGTQTVTNSFVAQGTRSNMVIIKSNSPGNTHTINTKNTLTNFVADFVNITDNVILNEGVALSRNATNAVNGGNNSNWAFSLLTPLDYYWSGGPGNWSDLSHWNTSSNGGATLVPATVGPGGVDNIFFNSNSFPSGGQLNIDSEIHIANMTWLNGSGTSFPSIYASSQNRIYISGSLQLDDGVYRNIRYLIFDSNTLGNKIDLADNLTDWGDIDFQGSGEWRLESDLKAAYLNIRGGTFKTQNHTLNLLQQIYIANNAGTVNLGSSEVNLQSLYNDSDGVNMTINMDNSTFNFTGQNIYLQGSYPLDFYNVTIDGDARMEYVDFTFNDLTINYGSSVEFGESRTFTVYGNFSAIGTRAQMTEISSTSDGVQSNLRIDRFSGGASINVEYLELQDIALDNGSASAVLEVAANSLNKGNNTGWDFASSPLTALNYFWIGGGGKWSDVNHWATTDGGATLHSFSPGRLDNVSFTSASFPSGGEVLLDQPASCNNMVWNDGSFNPSIRGDYENRLIIGGNLTIANGVKRNLEVIEFNSSSSNQLNFGDNSYEYSNIIFEGSGTWNLINDLATSSLTLRSGTIVTNDNALTIESEFIVEDHDLPLTLNFGSSKITAQYVYNWSSPGHVTADIGTSEIILRENGQFYGSEMGFYDVTLEGDASVYADLDVAGTLTIKPGGTLKIDPNRTVTIVNLDANGTRPLPVGIMSLQSGQQSTISKLSGTVSASHIILQDNAAVGGAIFNAVDAYNKGNVSGWNITEIVGQNYYWTASAGDWSDRNSWSLADGAVVAPATAPGPADNVLVTPNSAISAGGGMTIDIPAECNDMIWTTTSGGALSNDYDSPLTINGSFKLSSGVQNNIRYLIFNSNNIGNELNFADNLGNEFMQMEFHGTGEWTLLDSLIANYLQMQSGTLFTNGHPLNVRSIDLYNYEGASKLNLASSNVYTSYLYNSSFPDAIDAGTSTIYLNLNDRQTTVYYNWDFYNVVVDGIVNFRYGNNTFNELTLKPGSQVNLQAGTTQTVNKLIATGLRSRPITIASITAGSQASIVQSSGVVAGQYLVLKDNNGLGGAAFSAQNSIDEGNVSGWNITSISPRNYFWVGGSGKWSEFGTHWANADGGSNFFDSSPGPLDNVNFTANSFPSGGELILDFPTFVDNMTWSGTTSNVSITDQGEFQNSLSINGSLTLSNGVSRDLSDIYFTSDSPGNILDFADNKQSRNSVTFTGDGEWTLNSSLETYYLEFQNGTFNSNNQDLDLTYLYLWNNPVTYWGSSKVNTILFYNYADNSNAFNSETSVFTFTSPTTNRIQGGTNSRFYLAVFEGSTNISSENNVFFNATFKKGNLIMNSNNGFNSLSMAAGTTLLLGSGTTQTISAVLDLNGTVDEPVVVNASEDGTSARISMPSNATVNANYVHLKDNTATGGANFTATNSSDFGNVTGWTGLLSGQTIDFGALSDRPLSGGSFTVNATSSSSLPVSFEVASGSATISGNTISPTSSGLLSIRAVQAGNATYGSAKPVSSFIHIDATTEPNEVGNMKEAKLVIGQPDALSSDNYYAENITPRPWSTAVSKTGVLAVANGNRVLIWNQIPPNSSTPADVVIGQIDFTSDVEGASASTFYDGVYSVAFTNDDKLLVTDARGVLIYNTIPFVNGASADVIVGQSGFTGTRSGVGNDRFSGNLVTATTYYDENNGTEKLLVTDFGNSRVLIYNSIPTTNGATADVVIGQTDFNSNGNGAGANQLTSPVKSAVSPDGKLFIADYGNNRVVWFNSIPTTNGSAANGLLGQPDFGYADAGTNQTVFNGPTAVSISNAGKLAVADYVNHRVLIYNSLPANQNAVPNYILGQPNGTSADPNYSSISGRTMNFPIGVKWDHSNNLFVSDASNNRVLLYGAADLEAPVLSNLNMPASHTMNTGTAGSFTLTDRSGVVANMYYRGLSSANPAFTMKELTHDANGNFNFNTSEFYPSGEELGIEYRLEYYDGVGNTQPAGNETIPIRHPNGLSITKFGVGTNQENYRMFSVPLNLTSKDAKTVFDEITSGTYDDSKFRLFGFNAGGTTYTEYGSGITNIELGKGYIALAATGATVQSGEGITADVGTTTPFETTLKTGWNMIGNPYPFNVSWAEVLTESGISSGVSIPVTYDGTTNWPEQSVLNEGVGFFVNNTSGGDVVLKFPVVKTAGGRLSEIAVNKNSLNEESWEVRFMEKTIKGEEQQLGAVGMDPESEYSFDDRDRINLPAFAEQSKVEFLHPEFFQPSFRRDVRPTNYEEKWDFTFSAAITEEERTIHWDNSYYGENSPELYLLDRTHLKVINMKDESSYTFTHTDETKFEVYFGYDAYQALRPETLTGITPYPNPFTEQVKINVGIPQESMDKNVVVTIYNTLGKQVASLNTYSKGEAYLEFVWNGNNDSGQEVPNGIYAFRVLVEGELNEYIAGKLIKK